MDYCIDGRRFELVHSGRLARHQPSGGTPALRLVCWKHASVDALERSTLRRSRDRRGRGKRTRDTHSCHAVRPWTPTTAIGKRTPTCGPRSGRCRRNWRQRRPPLREERARGVPPCLKVIDRFRSRRSASAKRSLSSPSAVMSSGSSVSARHFASARRTSSCVESVSHASCVSPHGSVPFSAQASPASDEPAPERLLRRLPICRRPPFGSPHSPVPRPCRRSEARIRSDAALPPRQ